LLLGPLSHRRLPFACRASHLAKLVIITANHSLPLSGRTGSLDALSQGSLQRAAKSSADGRRTPSPCPPVGQRSASWRSSLPPRTASRESGLWPRLPCWAILAAGGTSDVGASDRTQGDLPGCARRA
jgi:hypothetical protein